MRFQVRWHLYRKPIFLLGRDGRDYRLRRIRRVMASNMGQTIVRFDGAVCKLYSAEKLKKFYRRKTGMFGRRSARSNAPRFLLDSREVVEDELNLPFLKQWEASLGPYG